MYLAKLPLICIFLSLSRLLMSLCVPVCLSVCVHHNSKNNGSVHLKLEHIVIYENGHMGIVLSRSSSQCDFFSPFTTIQTVKSFISALADVRKL